MNSSQSMLAMTSPESSVIRMDEKLTEQAVMASRTSLRKRIIYPLHKESGALLQRMLNAIQPGSYIRPHRHADDRAESIVVLQGAIRYLTFDHFGNQVESFTLRSGFSAFGVDIEGGVWHSFYALEPDTVLFEVKPGPYKLGSDKEFAEWAPDENSPDAALYLKRLQG